MTSISVIVCAHNEAACLPACLHSVLAQTRRPDEVIVVNNGSTDETRAVAAQIPYVRVVDEPRKGLVVARETGRQAAAGEILVYSTPTVGRRCSGSSVSSGVSRAIGRSPRCRSAIASMTGTKHFPYVANSDFHKPRHLYSWKTLVRSEKTWPAIKLALRNNVDIALTLFRKDSWAA